MLFPSARGLLAAFLVALPLAAQDAPRVVSVSPANETVDVDPTTTTLSIEFDRPMGNGHSVIGGGVNFPTVRGAHWKNPTTFVIEVTLEPDHDYAMGLNNRKAQNFRSAAGIPLEPMRWSFTTLPAELPNPREQNKRNKQALTALRKLLAEQYSYHDLRVTDWPKIFADNKPAILAAKTDVAWARATARMLEPTADIHLYLQAGQRVFATGRRSVDTLYRSRLLPKYLTLKPAGNEHASYGVTDDGIGYLMVASWTEQVDFDALEKAIIELRGCKAIVIDARPNSGGSERFAQRIAAWFVAGKQAYAKNRYRDATAESGFGPALDRILEGHTAVEKLFSGPIAVLTSRYVMSSNESFVMMLRQAKDCTVVGQPTFGSSGNPKEHQLANGVTIMVPSWQDLRMDGTCIEGQGIAPDVLVEVTVEDLKTRDPILEKALNLLRAKIGE